MQGHLRRFTHGTNEKTDTRHCQQLPVGTREYRGRQFTGFGEHLAIVHAAGIGEQQPNAQNETEVTHTVDEKGLHVRENGCGLCIPEANQQVRHQTHRFPTEEQLKHVVGHDQHQHREREQRYIGKETLIAGVIGHVANGVDVDHQ